MNKIKFHEFASVFCVVSWLYCIWCPWFRLQILLTSLLVFFLGLVDATENKIEGK
jgi:hypothetical protein